MRKNKWLLFYLFISVLLLGTGCGTAGKEQEAIGSASTFVPPVSAEPVVQPTPEPTPTPVPTPTPFPEYEVNLMMVGDNLMHMGIVMTGAQSDGTYSYDFLFQGIEEYLELAEVKMINQETILGGNEKGFSGYPHFNSPTEVGDAIAKAGFNVVLHSSNHTADKGVSGIDNCVAFWEQYPDVLAAGIYPKEGEFDIPILNIEGISFAILNYTYGPNMGSFPKDYEGRMDILCAYNSSNRMLDFTTLHEDVLADIDRAEQMADIVIVCPHWGTEYTTTPSRYQEQFARQMAEAGADVIIGTHPHVVQPVEWIEAENGNKALCFYSLGNYVSTQKQTLCMLEAMAWVTFRVTEEGIVIVPEETGVLPLVCHYTAMPVRLENVYLLEDYTEEQAAKHGIKSYGGVTLYLSELQEWSAEVFGDWVLTAEEIKE